MKEKTIVLTEQGWNAIRSALREAEIVLAEEDCPTPAEKRALADIRATLKTVREQWYACERTDCAYNSAEGCWFIKSFGREPELHDDHCEDFLDKEG